MVQSVNVPGVGQLNFPDGMSQADMAAAIQKNFPQIHGQDDSDPSHAGAAQKERIVADAKEYLNDIKSGSIKAVPGVGITEGALNMGSGILSSAAGGIAGLARAGYGLVKGEGVDAALSHGADTSQSVQQSATYQPRTAAGKLIMEAANVPLNAASEMTRSIGGDVGQVVGGDKGRIAGEEIGGIAPAVAATVMGGRAALKSVRPAAATPATVADETPINMIRNSNTESPQSAVTNRYDAAGDRVIPPEPASAEAGQPMEGNPNLYRIQRQAEGGNLPPEEQATRAQVLQRIGLENARRSAIEGDAMEGATQAQIAKFTQEPAGQAASELFNGERTALQNHAKNIIADTGGSEGMDASTLNSRGQVIAAPFDSLRQYFDSEIKKLYAQADEASGGVPETNLGNLEDFLGTKSNFAGKAENSSLGKGLSHYLREQGIMDSDGSLLPVTAKQAEGVKQYINSQWSPSTSGLAGKLKGIIDDDVFQGAGGDIYTQARNMYKMQKATLDNPSGIAKILDYDPQTPINRATPFEKIPDTLTNLPVSQFGHVVDVLNKILDPEYKTPELLQLQAHDALNEIKAHMANGLHETGSKFQTKWNAPGVTQYLKSNAPKFQMVFDDATLRKISDLNDAGHILSVDKSYPGAAAQGALAIKRGLLPDVVSRGAAGFGGLTGSLAGPLGTAAGAAVGSAAGDSLAASMGGKAALKRFNQGVVNIGDYLNPPTEAPGISPLRINGLIETAEELAPAAYVAGASEQNSASRKSALALEVERIRQARRQSAMSELSNAQTVDQAIQAAQRAVSQ